MHEALGDFVRRDIGPERANDRHLIDHRAQFRENRAHFDARLAALLELERRTESQTVMTRNGLVSVLRQLGFRIPRVDLRRAAGSEKVNDRLGLDREMRLPRSERPRGDRATAKRSADSFTQIDAEHAGKTQGAEAHARAHEEIPARENDIVKRGGMFAAKLVRFRMVGDWDHGLGIVEVLAGSVVNGSICDRGSIVVAIEDLAN